MKRLLRHGAWIVFAVFMAGCATTGPKFAEASPGIAKPAPDLGRIYFYRTMLLGAAVQPEVKLNNEVVGRAVPNGYFWVDRPPGDYVVSTTTEVENTASLKLAQGQIRYVKLNLSMGLFIGHIHPEVMDPDFAEKDMADTKFSPLQQ